MEGVSKQLKLERMNMLRVERSMSERSSGSAEKLNTKSVYSPDSRQACLVNPVQDDRINELDD